MGRLGITKTEYWLIFAVLSVILGLYVTCGCALINFKEITDLFHIGGSKSSTAGGAQTITETVRDLTGWYTTGASVTLNIYLIRRMQKNKVKLWAIKH